MDDVAALYATDVLTLGARLRAARLASGLEVEQFAELGGVTPSTLRLLERDGRPPTLATAQRLAETLSVSAAWLAFGEGPRSAGPPEPPRARASARAFAFNLPPELAASFERAGYRATLRVERPGTRLTREDVARVEALLAVWRHRSELAEAVIGAALNTRAARPSEPPAAPPGPRARR